jgi:hypothetical protein
MTVSMVMDYPIWPYIKKSITQLIEYRNSISSSEKLPGINFNIILSSACLVEGILETSLYAFRRYQQDLIFKQKDTLSSDSPKISSFLHRIYGDINSRIESSMGAEGYNKMFELLIGAKLSKLKRVEPEWEGLETLFAFRNVLAHGRRIIAKRNAISEIDYKKRTIAIFGWEEEYKGCYKKVEDYLLKHRLIKTNYLKDHSPRIYLTNEIGDHYSNLSLTLQSNISESLDKDEKVTYDWYFQQMTA